MISALFVIIKIIGMILLVILGILLFLAFLVLFVPVRYQITLRRKVTDDVPVRAMVKATWLCHILNGAFSYPDAAYIRIRIFWLTVFRTDQEKKTASKTPRKASKGEKEQPQKQPKKQSDKQPDKQPDKQSDEPPAKQPEKESAAGFWKKLIQVFQNIQYTIRKIYDKIKYIVKNIQYYLSIIKSDAFQRVWTVCGKEALALLKSILPKKIKGEILIGTGDPAGTGQVLAIYGMLYPLIGNHIIMTPDFEQQIVEGELFVKGKLTVFRAVKTVWVVYFNKDLRRLIQLFKREES